MLHRVDETTLSVVNCFGVGLAFFETTCLGLGFLAAVVFCCFAAVFVAVVEVVVVVVDVSFPYPVKI